MSTADKLNKLLETKEAIKQAIIDKGGTVGDVFAEYPTAIQNIQGGGGSGTFVVPAGMKFAYSNVEEFPEDWDWSDYANTTDLSYMFNYCENLKKVPKLIIPNATTTANMFRYCDFSEIDMGDWNLSKATQMDNMFDNCTNLMTVNWGTFDTSSNKKFTSMFKGCSNLKTIPELDCTSMTTADSSYNSALYGCRSLRNFGGFKGITKSVYVDTSYCLNYESLLNILNGLADGVSGQTLTLHRDSVDQLSDDDIAIATNKGWSVSPARTINPPVIVTDSSQIPTNRYVITPRMYDFSQYTGVWDSPYLPSNLIYLEADVSSSTSLSYMLSKCTSLKEFNLTGTQNVTDISYMMPEGKELDVSNWGVSELNCNSVFQNKGGYITLPSTIKLTGCNYLYYKNDRVTSIDTRGWDMSECKNASYMFTNAVNLTEIIGIEDWNVSSLETAGSIFYGCKSLKKLDLSKWDTSSLTSNSISFSGCENLEEVNIKGLDFSKCGYFNEVFADCKKLKHIDLSDVKFESGNLTAYSTFVGCENLISLTMNTPIKVSTSYTKTWFNGVNTNGTFYYNPAYDYSTIIEALPATWTAEPLTE